MKLLDLFCCEGGAGVGYSKAGFEVFGVDLFEEYTQKRYPFDSHKGDALEYLKAHGEEYDVIHASPPCQHASSGTRAIDRSKYPQLIQPTREILIELGRPYVIENVRGADLIDPVELCGCMFDMGATDTDGIYLHLQRPRLFESNIDLVAPKAHDHSDHEWVGGSYGGARRDKYEAKYVRKGGYVPPKAVQQVMLGIDWMTERGMYQAIPPTYTEWIGTQIIEKATHTG